MPQDDSGNEVPVKLARAAWVSAARPLLERTARTYNATITYGDLAREVQETTGITTKQLIHYSIGEIAFECQRPDEPMLSSLVVSAEETVGPGYEWAIHQVYGDLPIEDLQLHAAEERLKCYRYFGATLPRDGGVPTLTPKVADRRRRARSRGRASEQSTKYCPNCHLALPASGQCDMCGD